MQERGYSKDDINLVMSDKTRKQMKDKADDYSDVLAEKFESAKKDAENLAEKGKSKFYDAKKMSKTQRLILSTMSQQILIMRHRKL